MKFPRLPSIAAFVLLGACAAFATDPPERNARLRLDRGLAALDAGRYDAAFDDLAWVRSHCRGHETGEAALVALAALELDPRNRDGRPGLGTELLGRIIRRDGPDRATRLLAETTFLNALALGAPHPEDGGTAGAGGPPGLAALEPVDDPVARCGAVQATPADSTRPLPVLPGPSLAALLDTARAARDSAVLRLDTLTTELAEVRAELTATREELERIRKTLKP